LKKEKKYFSLPVEIVEVNTNFSFDNSLIPVDIKVMHNGLNFNNSTFEDDSIENAKESLKNKPILGYIKKIDGSDAKDFAGHEVEITFGEEGLKVTYLERPLGLVPESNNYSISEEDDKKYVVCRGYLWREYLNSGYEILKDNPNKSVSMEIAVDDYEANEDGTINITKYRYLGITILGDDIQPAMKGAKLSVIGQFSEGFTNDFHNKIEELNEKIANFTTKGGEKEKMSEPIKFELSHDDIRGKLFDILNPKNEDGYREWNYWIMKVYDSYIIVEDENDMDNYYKFNYSISEDEEIVLGEKVKVYLEFLTQEQKDALDEMKNNFKLLQEEVVKLREFKSQKEQEEFNIQLEKQRQEKIDYINNEYQNLSEEIKNEFINKIDQYENIEDLDADICIYIVKNKLQFSRVKQEAETVKINIAKNVKDIKLSPYGDLF